MNVLSMFRFYIIFVETNSDYHEATINNNKCLCVYQCFWGS